MSSSLAFSLLVQGHGHDLDQQFRLPLLTVRQHSGTTITMPDDSDIVQSRSHGSLVAR